MTINQLKEFGFETNKWVTVTKPEFHGLLFSNEGNIFSSDDVSPQIYIESDTGLIFLRKTYLDGKTDPALENDPDYIGIDNNGIIKYYKLISGGIDDVVIGRYHSVYSISDITMIF